MELSNLKKGINTMALYKAGNPGGEQVTELLLVRIPVIYCPSKSDLICVLELIANGNTTCKGGHTYIILLQPFVQVEISCVAFHRGAEREDYLIRPAIPDLFLKAIDLEIRWTDAVNRRNNSAKNMINTPELPRVLDSHNILDAFHNTDYLPVSFLVIAYIADLIIRDVMTYLAISDFLMQPCNALSKPPYISCIPPEQMHHKPEGCFSPYARQGCKLIYGLFKQSRWEFGKTHEWKFSQKYLNFCG